MLTAIRALPEESGRDAINAFTAHDLERVTSLLLSHYKQGDPAYAKVTNAAEFRAAAKNREDEINQRVEIYKKRYEDAQRRYDIFLVRNAGDQDRKDGLLMETESVQHQYETERHRQEQLAHVRACMVALDALLTA